MSRRKSLKQKWKRHRPAAAHHEAAHAVAAFLVAPWLGCKVPELVIEYVTLGEGKRRRGLFGPKPCTVIDLWDQALLPGVKRDSRRNWNSLLTFREIFAAVRNAGVDIERVVRAEVFMLAMGPAAEARFHGVSIEQQLAHRRCTSDRRSIEEIFELAYEPTHQTEGAKRLAHVLKIAKAKLDEPQVWAAISAIAEELLRHKELTGKEAFQAYQAGFNGPKR